MGLCGWQCYGPANGFELANPAGISITDASATPRKYGFHGTIKPPFRLADGTDESMLGEQAAQIASGLAPVTIEALEIRAIGGFLALVPKDPSTALTELAGRFVTGLDGFQKPAGPAELARRRAAGLSRARKNSFWHGLPLPSRRVSVSPDPDRQA